MADEWPAAAMLVCVCCFAWLAFGLGVTICGVGLWLGYRWMRAH